MVIENGLLDDCNNRFVPANAAVYECVPMAGLVAVSVYVGADCEALPSVTEPSKNVAIPVGLTKEFVALTPALSGMFVPAT